MSAIVCESCGTANPPGTEFCTACGTFLDWESAGSGATRPMPAAGRAPSAPPAGHAETSVPLGGPAPAPYPGPAPASPSDLTRGPWPGPDPTVSAAPVAPTARAAAPPPAADVGYRLIVPQGAPPPPGLGESADAGRMGTTSHGAAAAGTLTAVAGAVEAPPVPDGTCRDCGRVNPPELRFCAKCGYRFPDRPSAGAPDAATSGEPLPWWRHWLPHRRLGTASARRSFRRSLPMRYRVRRYIISAVVLVLVVALLFVSGRNPVGWVSDRIADLRGTLAPVAQLTATGEPQDSVLADHPPGYAIDNLADTSWGVSWAANPATPVSPDSCVPTASAPASGSVGSLLITLPEPKKIRAIEVAAGLPADDPLRTHQWLPKALELSFSDGQCQLVPLANTADLQRISIQPVTTSQVRVQVVEAEAPPPDQPVNVVALSEIRLLARP